MSKVVCNCIEYKFYLQYSGSQVGKYCSNCNKWLKWVGKKDLEVLQRNGMVVYKQGTVMPNKATQGSTMANKTYNSNKGVDVNKPLKDIVEVSNGEVVPSSLKFQCAKCFGSDFYLVSSGGRVAQRCLCHSWIKWVGKSDVLAMQSNGYKIHTNPITQDSNSLGLDNNIPNLDNNIPNLDCNISSNHSNIPTDDSNVYNCETNRLHSDTNISGSNINTSYGECSRFETDRVILEEECNITKSEENIEIKDTLQLYLDLNIDEKDIKLLKSDKNINNFDSDISKSDIDIRFLKMFLRRSPKNCNSCSLDELCGGLPISLCNTVRLCVLEKESMDYVEDLMEGENSV